MRNESADPEIINGNKQFSGNPYMKPYTQKEIDDANEAFKKIKKDGKALRKSR